MLGPIGKMKVVPGQRDNLVSILLVGTENLPGCLNYIIARKSTNLDSTSITEAWASQDFNRASLSLPIIQSAIAAARPIIAGFGKRFETFRVDGHGIVAQ